MIKYDYKSTESSPTENGFYPCILWGNRFGFSYWNGEKFDSPAVILWANIAVKLPLSCFNNDVN